MKLHLISHLGIDLYVSVVADDFTGAYTLNKKLPNGEWLYNNVTHGVFSKEFMDAVERKALEAHEQWVLDCQADAILADDPEAFV